MVSGADRIGLREWLILGTVQLTTLSYGMSVTAASVVLPQIRGALSATQDQIAWVVTFNLVATAIVTPVTGWLAGKLGWRLFMSLAIAGFTVSSVLCGLAGSLEALVAFRVLQGAFGAPLMPLGQGIILASFPRHMHALVMMLWGFGGVMGPVLGPLLGGALAEALDWRWAFLMIVPFCALALGGALVALGDQERGTAPRLDWVGFLALACALGAGQLMLDRGQRHDWFDSPEIVIEAAVAAGGLYIFIVHTLTADRPFLSPKLLADRNFALGVFMAFAMGWLSYTPIVLFPPLLQDLRGYPDSIVGTLISARGVGNWFSFWIVVQFTRRAPRLCLATGIALQAAAGLAMARLDINMTSFDVFWTNMLQGFGFGLSYTPMAVLAFSTLAPRLTTEGSAVFNMMRNIGSSAFISLSVLVLVIGTAESYAGLSEAITPFNELLRYPLLAGAFADDTAAGLAAAGVEVRRQAGMVGDLNAFWLFTAAAALAVPLVALFKVAPAAGR
jgi:MFS transporter, DHA2 family, multidrug resistance protein